MEMTAYTATEKLKEIERELYFRRRVYKGMIDRNQMTKKTADKQITIMEAIAQDYRRLAAQDELPLNQGKEAIT
jgi:hypothetical protein